MISGYFMKSPQRTFLETILRRLARWTIARYQPDVVGVTGSVGKTSTKDAIACVLRGHKQLRVSEGNLNNEVGLPLGILSESVVPKTIGGWVRMVAAACIRILARGKYPELLVLEYAADHPGDINYLTGIARPRIGVVTAVGEVPVHIEHYESADAVAREKSRLIEALPAAGFAILNYDDPRVRVMGEKTRAKVITYGFEEGAEVRVSNLETRIEGGIPAGISFKLEYGGSFVPVRMERVVGRAPAYAAAAAAAVGIAFGLHLVQVAEGISYYVAPKHRMKLLRGFQHMLILDDTYNASPLSMHEAVRTVSEIPGKRKVAVLGDMRELGKFSVAAHEYLGREAAEVFDVICTVGEYARFIAEGARKARQSKKHIVSYPSVEEAIAQVPGLLRKDDVVLVKGSRALELERLVEKLVYYEN